MKFPSTVALVWRWTGDNRFRDEMYDFTVRNLKYVVNKLDADHDGWPEGLGNVERTGMGPEKLDNTVYFIRGLYDLADMAQSKHDTRDVHLGHRPGHQAAAKFDTTWWYQAASQYADSLGDPATASRSRSTGSARRRWRPSCTSNGQTVPGLAPYEHGTTALAGRENDCYSGTAPLNPGLFHTGCGGGPEGLGEKVIYGLTTSIQSVGEGNYGRLGAGQQGRYTDALARPMFAEPATGGTPDEQPGAMPETFPSPDQGANIDRCWTCRSMFMQAWGNYGTAWPVVHQWLGVQPDLGVGPADARAAGAAGADRRAGQGDPARRRLGGRAGDAQRQPVHAPRRREPRRGRARACGSGTRCRAARRRRGCCSTGTSCPATRSPQTNRGDEVTVPTTAGQHTLVVQG